MDAGDELRHTADRLLAGFPRAPTRAPTFDSASWATIEAAGLPAALLPEHAGGFGATPSDALSLLRVAGVHALPLPLAETMLAGWLLAHSGIDVPPGPLTLAEFSDAVLAHGHAAGIAHDAPWGRHAAHLVVLSHGTLALVPIAACRIEPGLAISGDPADTLHLDAPARTAPCPITSQQLRAAGAATRTLLIAGALQAVLDLAVKYANDRVQFGKPIGRFQAVQQNLALLAGHAAAAAAAAHIAADRFPEPLPLAAAKVRANEAAGAGAAIAHQVLGAIGFTEDHHLHRYTRRLWAWRDQWGTEAEWSRLLGRHIAEAGPDRLWAELAAL